MSLTIKYAALVLGYEPGMPHICGCPEYRHLHKSLGRTVTDTRTLQHGQYTNNKTVTSPSGRTYTKNVTGYLSGSGRLMTQTRRTGPNGRSVTSKTWHGTYSAVTRVSGPNGGSRVYRRPK
jgi:hypothetical protein